MSPLVDALIDAAAVFCDALASVASVHTVFFSVVLFAEEGADVHVGCMPY